MFYKNLRIRFGFEGRPKFFSPKYRSYLHRANRKESRARFMGPTKRRKCVIGGVARSYRDDGLIRGDFQGESTAQGCPADKEVNACASAQESKDVRVRTRRRGESRFQKRDPRPVGPGPRFGREPGPGPECTSRLVSPRLAAPGGPDPFIPWDLPRHGMPLLSSLFSLSLSLFLLFSPLFFPLSRLSPSARRRNIL